MICDAENGQIRRSGEEVTSMSNSKSALGKSKLMSNGRSDELILSDKM